MNYIQDRQFDIETTCEKCYYNPKSHSFYKLNESCEEVYFYTCHAKSKYYKDDEGFVKHMRLEIEKIKNKNWIWIFDGSLFGFKHLCTPRIGMEIIRLLDNVYGNNMHRIIIINENMPFRIMLSTIWYYIPDYIKNKFIFDKNKSFSELLNIDDKLYLLEKKLTY